MKLPFFSRPVETPAAAATAVEAAAAWPWPGCGSYPKTLSFRANNDIFKTINSAYLDDAESVTEFEICNPDDNSGTDESAVVGALRSERLFFRPGESSSILEEAKTQSSSRNDAVSIPPMELQNPCNDAVAILPMESPDPYPVSGGNDAVSILAVDSDDPYGDFRASMEEMVAAHGLKDWECLEDLLACYLRVNCRSNHGYIVGAFVDLLFRRAAAAAVDENCGSSSPTTTTQNSFTSPLSFSSSSSTTSYSSAGRCLSSPENEAPAACGNKEDSEASSSSSGV